MIQWINKCDNGGESIVTQKINMSLLVHVVDYRFLEEPHLQ